MEKAELRRTILERLKSFPEKEEESKIIREKILSMRLWRDAETILAFYPLSTEPDISPILSDKRVLLPFIDKEGKMEFGRGKLVRNKLGFMEPEKKEAVYYKKALMLVPLVAVDSSLSRLGRGKGFYDRYISENRERLILLGVAFSPSLVERVPHTELDQRLDGLITAEKVIPDHF